MPYTSELHALALITTATALMWVPYVCGRMATFGILAPIGNPGPGYPIDPPWMDRARRAHANAVENLVVFAPLVLIAAIVGLSTPVTTAAAWTYVVARLVTTSSTPPASPSCEPWPSWWAPVAPW